MLQPQKSRPPRPERAIIDCNCTLINISQKQTEIGTFFYSPVPAVTKHMEEIKKQPNGLYVVSKQRKQPPSKPKAQKKSLSKSAQISAKNSFYRGSIQTPQETKISEFFYVNGKENTPVKNYVEQGINESSSCQNQNQNTLDRKITKITQLQGKTGEDPLLKNYAFLNMKKPFSFKQKKRVNTLLDLGIKKTTTLGSNTDSNKNSLVVSRSELSTPPPFYQTSPQPFLHIFKSATSSQTNDQIIYK